MTDAQIAAAADTRVQEALEHIEKAQLELGRACELLCPIIGGVKAWERVGKLYDRVHAEWHRTNGWALAHRARLDLDEGGRRELARAGACGLHGVACPDGPLFRPTNPEER